MTDKRETDLLAYILSGFVIAVSGIAVGVASFNPSVPGRITSAVSGPTSAAVAPDTRTVATVDHRTPGTRHRGH